MADLNQELKARIQEIDEMLPGFLPAEEGYQKTVITAMKYSLMAGGKRIRPILMESSFEFFGGKEEPLLKPFMASLEMIHTYSLIHDDLPAMDNDDYRRGKLTSHKVFGEAMAILAGDALLNYAYETASRAVDEEISAILSDGSIHDQDQQSRIARAAHALKILGEKPGVNGMLGGQVVDVELTGQKIPEDTLRFIFDYKTGALIEAAMMTGACLAGVSGEKLDHVRQAAHDIGMAFQIQDDILDITSTQEELGKPVHSDEKNDKSTWPSIYGLEKSKEDVETYSDRALSILKEMYPGEGAEDTFLYRFVRWLIHRKY